MLQGSRFNRKGVLSLTFEDMNRHAMAFGETGSGKTEGAIRLCASLGAVDPALRIVYIDAKGSPETELRFKAAMRLIGRSVGVYPDYAYDIWRGDDAAIHDKLMSSLDFTGTLPYHQNAADILTSMVLATAPGQVRSSRTFMQRLNEAYLLRHYADDPAQLGRVKFYKAENLFGGVLQAYDVLFLHAHGRLDGRVAVDDMPTAYIRLPGVDNLKQNKVEGRLILHDIRYAMKGRIPAPVRMLVIIDEIARLASVDESVAIFQQMRDLGDSVRIRRTAIVGTTQSYADLEAKAKKITGAGGMTIAFRMPDPQDLTRRAGTVTEQVQTFSKSSAGGIFSNSDPRTTVTWREEERPRLDWNSILQLADGQAAIIVSGDATIAQFGMVQLPPGALALAQQPLLLPRAQQLQREEVSDPDAEAVAAPIDPPAAPRLRRERPKVHFPDETDS